MRTRKRYPDNLGVMDGEYRNALRLGYRGCHMISPEDPVWLEPRPSDYVCTVI